MLGDPTGRSVVVIMRDTARFLVLVARVSETVLRIKEWCLPLLRMSVKPACSKGLRVAL